MLQLDGLRLSQGAFTLAADLWVVRGARVAVMGPSGSGKSTLLAAIAGFLRPVAGRVLWDGADLTPLGPGERPVSILFQDNNLFPHLTVAQNVGLGMVPRLRLTKAESDRVEEVLAQVGLQGMGDRRPGALSGGQQSRAALARVLLSARPLVLLDEPFAALGPGLRAEMLDLAMTTLREGGRTLVMVTHDPADAVRIADSVIEVSEGWAKPPVPIAQFLAAPSQAMRAYLGKDES